MLRTPLLAALAIAALGSPTVAAASDTPLMKRTDHVVIISLDGLRPDAIARYRAKTLQRLMREGRYSLEAQTILPSKTLPSHTSMLTGVDADQHGITWNSDQVDDHGHVSVPTIFALAKDAGLQTAAFFSKTKFHHLEVPESMDYVRSPSGSLFDGDRWSAARTAQNVEDYLESPGGDPNLIFVHIGEPDYAGHVWGWMSPVYGAAVQAADQAVAEVIDEAADRWGLGNFTVIVTADHGGHDKGHGSSDPRDTTIPWITWGKGVAAGAPLPEGIRTMDTAATALWLLGIGAPEAWVGRPVTGAFATAAVTSD